MGVLGSVTSEFTCTQKKKKKWELPKCTASTSSVSILPNCSCGRILGCHGDKITHITRHEEPLIHDNTAVSSILHIWYVAHHLAFSAQCLSQISVRAVLPADTATALHTCCDYNFKELSLVSSHLSDTTKCTWPLLLRIQGDKQLIEYLQTISLIYCCW